MRWAADDFVYSKMFLGERGALRTDGDGDKFEPEDSEGQVDVKASGADSGGRTGSG